MDEALKIPHAWSSIPFSSHHGDRNHDYECGICGLKLVNKIRKELPKTGCIEISEDDY